MGAAYPTLCHALLCSARQVTLSGAALVMLPDLLADVSARYAAAPAAMLRELGPDGSPAHRCHAERGRMAERIMRLYFARDTRVEATPRMLFVLPSTNITLRLSSSFLLLPAHPAHLQARRIA